jgi:hypothetical protein
MWIDLASAEHTDAGPGSLTEIGLGRATSGALYLISAGLRPAEAATATGASTRAG